MSLNDKQIESADILSKNYKLTDGEGMHLARTYIFNQ